MVTTLTHLFRWILWLMGWPGCTPGWCTVCWDDDGAICYPDAPSLTYCPAHCPEHDYQHEPGEGRMCVTCGDRPSPDYYDGWFDDAHEWAG